MYPTALEVRAFSAPQTHQAESAMTERVDTQPCFVLQSNCNLDLVSACVTSGKKNILNSAFKEIGFQTPMSEV